MRESFPHQWKALNCMATRHAHCSLRSPVAIFGDLRRMYLLNSNHIKFRMVDLLACYLHQMLYYYEKTKLAFDFLWTTIIFGARKYCVILKRFLSCAA